MMLTPIEMRFVGYKSYSSPLQLVFSYSVPNFNIASPSKQASKQLTAAKVHRHCHHQYKHSHIQHSAAALLLLECSRHLVRSPDSRLQRRVGSRSGAVVGGLSGKKHGATIGLGQNIT